MIEVSDLRHLLLLQRSTAVQVSFRTNRQYSNTLPVGPSDYPHNAMRLIVCVTVMTRQSVELQSSVPETDAVTTRQSESKTVKPRE